MFARPSYGFGKPVSTEVLRVLHRWVGSDGILRQVKVVRWTFGDGVVRTCRVYESFRRCKTGGQDFPGYEGRWAWTGERYTEPEADIPISGFSFLSRLPVG